MQQILSESRGGCAVATTPLARSGEHSLFYRLNKRFELNGRLCRVLEYILDHQRQTTFEVAQVKQKAETIDLKVRI